MLPPLIWEFSERRDTHPLGPHGFDRSKVTGLLGNVMAATPSKSMPHRSSGRGHFSLERAQTGGRPAH